MVKHRDSGYYRRIEQAFIGNVCYEDIADISMVKHRDSGYYRRMERTFIVNVCYEDIADISMVKHRDSGYCRRIEQAFIVNVCYVDIEAISMVDPSAQLIYCKITRSKYLLQVYRRSLGARGHTRFSCYLTKVFFGRKRRKLVIADEACRPYLCGVI